MNGIHALVPRALSKGAVVVIAGESGHVRSGVDYLERQVGGTHVVLKHSVDMWRLTERSMGPSRWCRCELVIMATTQLPKIKVFTIPLLATALCLNESLFF